MTNLYTNLKKHKKSKAFFLDTLELTSDYRKKISLESQYHKAIAKYKTITKLVTIIDSISCKKTKTNYWRTYHCQNVLLQSGRTFKGSLCRKRWCANCCRIKTAELTNGYKQPLLDLGQLYFVTLTRPNVKGRELKSEISKLIKGFQSIKDNLRKNYSIKLNGIRKIEVTYNKQDDSYHPHFHFIQDNKQGAELMKELWLNYFVTATNQGQDIRPIDCTNDNSFIELFKYATKETTKGGEAYSGEVLHTIYSAISGKRIYQTYGKIHKVKPLLEAQIEKSEIHFVEPNNDIWVYDLPCRDWLNSTNQALINTNELESKIKLYQSLKTNICHVPKVQHQSRTLVSNLE